MRYTIEKAKGGWVAHDHTGHSKSIKTLFAVAPSLHALASLIEPVSVPPITALVASSAQVATWIVNCHNSGPPNKISMIKLHRAIMGTHLKESKEAIEEALAKQADKRATMEEARWG